MILPKGLSNDPITDFDFIAKEGAWTLEGGKHGMIPRTDLARYLIKTIEEDLHRNKIVAVTQKVGETKENTNM